MSKQRTVEQVLPARETLEGALSNGSALESFRAMVEAQGGDPRALDDSSLLVGSEGIVAVPLQCPVGGYVSSIDALEVGRAVAALGGGRGSDGAPPDPAVGVVLETRIGDGPLPPDSPIATIHCRTPGRDGLDEARDRVLRAFTFVEEPPAASSSRVLAHL